MWVFLVACHAPKPPTEAAPADSPGDTADPADDDSAPDTGVPPDSGGGGEDSLVWTGTFLTAPDVRITACGSLDEDDLDVAEGPDLDGDGLPELAIGSRGADGDVGGEGRVYFFLGADLAAGRVNLFSPHTTLSAPAEPDDGLGSQVQWVGDRDGDGIDDLLVDGTSAAGLVLFASGADLLAGGELTPAPTLLFGHWNSAFPTRWDDLDDDGSEDWLVSVGHAGLEMVDEGAVFVASDASFTEAGIPTWTTAVRGGAEYYQLGLHTAPLSLDMDGDGVRELLSLGREEAVLLGSAAILGGAETVDEAALARATGVEYPSELVVLGDVDGGGVEEVVFLHASLCVVRGEELANGGDVPPACYTDADFAIPSLLAPAGDVDGDGDLDAWAVEGTWFGAVDAQDLVAGTWTPTREVALGPIVGLDVADGAVWATRDLGTWLAAEQSWRVGEDGTVERTVVGGGWGGEPVVPYVRDVDGDGLDDLIFEDDRVHVVTGAQLTVGGEVSLCEAAYAFAPGADETAVFFQDLTGDNVDEVVLGDRYGEGLRRVVDGATLLGGGGEVLLHTFESGPLTSDMPRCDLATDGAPTFTSGEGGALVVYREAIAAGSTRDEARLGTVTGLSAARCAPDLDGDGLEEFVAQVDGTDGAWAVVSAVTLSPDAAVDAALADLTFYDDGEARTNVWDEPLFAGELGGVRVWGWSSTEDHTGWLSVEDLPASGEMAWDQVADTIPWALESAWLEDVVGDEGTDLVAHVEVGLRQFAFVAIDGNAPIGHTVLLETVTEYLDYWEWEAGRGPDPFAVGASGLWLLSRPKSTKRNQLELVFARRE